MWGNGKIGVKQFGYSKAKLNGVFVKGTVHWNHVWQSCIKGQEEGESAAGNNPSQARIQSCTKWTM